VHFSYEELLQRDKCNLDIFWLKDESLEDSASLPEPDVIIVDIIEDLRTVLEQLEEIAGDVSVADEVQRQTAMPRLSLETEHVQGC